jgi:hypothetical protein
MHKHETISLNGETIISVRCMDCGETKQFTVKTAHYDAWVKGQVIQRAMPEIPEDERELLISGSCGPCFDKLFGDDQ